MITCLVCTARARPARVYDRLCADCLADKDAARATLARRRQMSERRLQAALATMTRLISAADERLGEAALPSLTIVLMGLLPVIWLSRAIGKASGTAGGRAEP